MKRFFAFLCSLIVVVPAAAAVRGTVITIDGAPLSGATIEAYLPEGSEARTDRWHSDNPKRAAIATATTDATGSFALDVKKRPVVDVTVAMRGYEPVVLKLGGDDDAGAILMRSAAMVNGKVTGGGKPAANAQVIFRATTTGAEYITSTDSEGRYSVPDPKVWNANATVLHPDFAPLSESGFGRRTPALDFQLTAGSPVSGKVLSDDGKTPVPGATVRIDGRSVTTGEDGTFTVEHVAQKRPPITATLRDRVGINTSEERQVTLKMGRGATVTGVVRDAKTQRPLPGASVSLNSGDFAGPSIVVISDEKGVFTFKNTAAARSWVTAAFPNYWFSGTAADARSGQTVTVNVTGVQNATVIGKVVDEAKKPMAAVRVVATPVEDTFTPGMRFMRVEEATHSAPDGRFVLRYVPPDLQLELAAVRRGFPRGTAGPFKFASGELKQGVSITVPFGITVSGRVTDLNDKPVAGVVVLPNLVDERMGARMVVRGQPGSERDTNVETTADGAFSVQLKEGRYDIAFRREGYAPKRVRGYTVTRDSEPLNVRLDRGVEIRGRVVRRDGSGVADANVNAMFEAAESIRTAPDGSFTIPDLAPGPVVVMVMKPDEFVREVRNATAPADDLLIEIPPGGRIQGRVVEKGSGKAVTQFRVTVPNTIDGRTFRFAGPPMGKTFSSEDGSFVLENVPAGKADLFVDAGGYVQGSVPGIAVEEGKTVSDVVVELDTGVRLTGKVTGADGAPLAGATVQADSTEDMMVRRFTRFGAQTDGSGEYVLEAIEPGEKTFVFQRAGYLTERRTVKLSGKESRLDVRMSRGRDVTGIIVDDSGAPVANASVNAMSGNQDAGFRSTRSDASGTFRFEGLAPGRYTFRASKTGFVSGEAKDVDIDAVNAGIRITLAGGGTISGTVRGLTESELANTSVSAVGSSGRRASAPVDPSGRYRVEGVAPGTVRVTAQAGTFPGFRSTQAQSVEVAAGSEVQLDLEFRSDVVIRGRVTRQGKPVGNAMVSFDSRNPRVQSRATARTDAGGLYEVSGIEPAPYSVDVIDMAGGRTFTTTYEVSGSGTFDIEMRGGSIRGRVTDADSGEPIAGALVNIQEADTHGRRMMPLEAVTDSAGTFTLNDVSAGPYRARAQKERYGAAVVDMVVSENETRDLELKLTRTDGIRMRVVDARDNRPLSPYLWVRDQQGRSAYEGNPRPNSEGVLVVPLGPGAYRVTAGAMGYASRTLPIVVPSQEIRVGLTPGGTLVVDSTRSVREVAKLLTPSGDFFQRGAWAPTEIVLHQGSTTIENLAPGPYVLQLLDERGNVKSSHAMTIAEGQIARVEI